MRVAEPESGEQKEQCCWRDDQPDTHDTEKRQSEEGEGRQPHEIAVLGPRAIASDEDEPKNEYRPEKRAGSAPATPRR